MARERVRDKRTFRRLAPMVLLTLGVLLLLTFAIFIAFASPPPPVVTLGVLPLGIALLIAGLAWGAEAPAPERQEY